MSVLLFVVGAAAFMVGVGMVGFGIPVNEFSFGNTLIVAGTSAAAGGLIVIGLGAVVAKLQRIADSLSIWTPEGSSEAAEMFEPPHGVSHAAPPAGQVPFQPRPKSEVKPEVKSEVKPAFKPAPASELKPDELPELPKREATAAVSRMAVPAAAASSPEDIFAGLPSLRNPDIPPVEVAGDVSLSPGYPAAVPDAGEPAEPARTEPPPFGYYGSTMNQRRQDAGSAPAAWRDPPPPAPPAEAPPASARSGQSSYFDAMWPEPAPKSGSKPEFTSEPSVETTSDSAAAEDGTSDARLDLPEPRQEGLDAAAPPEAPVAEDDRLDEPARGAAILKSGVVDGMGYTLYVDGSIEAELPQGTLRFSSINDLRNYLEKNA